MKLVVVTDWDSNSGYYNAFAPVIPELVDLGHEIKVLGISYDGKEHHHPFQVIPVSKRNFLIHIAAMFHNLKLEGWDNHLVALDVPLQLSLTEKMREPIYGVFPIEAPPVTDEWAFKLGVYKHCFCMSQFGTKLLTEKAVATSFIELAPRVSDWPLVDPEARALAKKTMWLTDYPKAVLTIADNQERKNLSQMAEIIAATPGTYWILVTRLEQPTGWNIVELLNHYGIYDRTIIFDRGIPQEKLVGLYAAADVFAITSKAEGLGMPVLQAMLCGVPVVAPAHTSFEEHLGDGRGFLFPTLLQSLEPFGNEYRYYCNVKLGAQQLTHVLDISDTLSYEWRMSRRQYVADRTPAKAAQVIHENLS